MNKRNVSSLMGRLRWACCLGAVPFVFMVPTYGVEVHTSETEEPELKRQDIVVSYGKPDLDKGSSEAALQEDFGLRDSGSGGIERFYWENRVDGDWRIYLDSYWLANPDEAGVSLEIQDGYTVFFNLDYSQWKEYDFGSGIWYPPTNTFAILSADALEEEINRIDVSLEVHPADNTRLELAYSLFNREGEKLSTRYGDDNQFQVGGIPSRGIIPALVSGDETVHSFDARLIHQDYVDLTGFRFHYQRREVERTHVVERAAQQPAANRFTTQDESSKDDLFSASGFARREFSDTLVGSMGFVFTRLDGDITGNRIFGAAPEAAYDIDFAALQLRDRGFLDLESSRKLKQWIFNLNGVYTPSENVRWMAGVRIEHLNTEAFGSYLDTHRTVDWAAQEIQNEEASMLTSSDKSALDISAFLEGRYTGLKHILLYSRLEAGNQDGDLDEGWSREELFPDVRDPLDLLDRDTDFDRHFGFWEAGANYYPSTGLRLSLSGYLKYRENDYSLDQVRLPEDDFTLYPGYIRNQSILTRDINARIHWRIFDSLKSVTRADYQETDIDTESGEFNSIESSARERFVLSQSLTWSPVSRFFASASVNYVDDLTETGASDLEDTFGGIVVNVPNDYWHADLTLYYVASKLIDIQLGYTHMEFTNFMDTSPATIPYGTDLRQRHGSAELIFNFSQQARARLGYFIYDREEPSAGGFRDYTAHLVNGSFQLIF